MGIQLRCRTVLHLGWCQAAVVLQDPPRVWPADATAGPSRSLQLRGWVHKLAGGLVSPQEGMVLSGSWQRLPDPRWWMRSGVRAIRLRCWICQLDARLVCCEEGMVLLEQGQGLSSGSWRLRLIVSALGGLDSWRWHSCHLPVPVMTAHEGLLRFYSIDSTPMLVPSSGVDRMPH